MIEPLTDLTGELRRLRGRRSRRRCGLSSGPDPRALTAAYELTKAGRRSTVLEADSVVGGISRTVEREGWRFDIGGHRFFTKVQRVDDLWHEILPDGDFMLRPRKSRIYYQGKFYDYPLRAMNALGNLGAIEAVRCVLSYLWAGATAEATGHVRGMAGRPVRLAALPALLQDLHGEGLGAPALGNARRLGGPAGQEPVADQRHLQRPPAETQPEEHHLVDRGIPVPGSWVRG